jgi:hypothetical protein
MRPRSEPVERDIGLEEPLLREVLARGPAPAAVRFAAKARLPRLLVAGHPIGEPIETVPVRAHQALELVAWTQLAADGQPMAFAPASGS